MRSIEASVDIIARELARRSEGSPQLQSRRGVELFRRKARDFFYLLANFCELSRVCKGSNVLHEPRVAHY